MFILTSSTEYTDTCRPSTILWQYCEYDQTEAGDGSAQTTFCVYTQSTYSLADTRSWTNVGLTLVQRRWRWTKVKTTLIQRLVYICWEGTMWWSCRANACHTSPALIPGWAGHHYCVHMRGNSGQIGRISFVLSTPLEHFMALVSRQIPYVHIF